MKKAEALKKIKQEAHNSNWVVVAANGDIWGSEASYSALRLGGGKRYVLNADSIRSLDTASNILEEGIDLEEVAQDVENITE